MPEAFQFGPLIFRTHLLFFLFGAWLSSELLFRLMKRKNLRVGLLLKNGPYFLLGFLLGGRILAVLLYFRVYIQNPIQVLIFWDGYFSGAGAGIGLLFVLYILLHKKKQELLTWMDVLMPPTMLLLTFDWIGRFFGAISYGKPTDIFWGVTYNSIGVRYTVPIHPVQMYYAVWFFLITIILLYLHKRQLQQTTASLHIHERGYPTIVGMTLACIGVLCFEFLRGDFAITVFAKLSDILFLGFLFTSLGVIAVIENRIQPKTSIVLSSCIGLITVTYIIVRPSIAIVPFEWRLSQFAAVLAILATVVYVVAHRWKFPLSSLIHSHRRVRSSNS